MQLISKLKQAYFTGYKHGLGDAKIAIIIVIFIIGIVIILEHCYNPEIKPIDVYRGLTTLEITYRDGTPVDSVVIWKEK